jgi:hypothetical protein
MANLNDVNSIIVPAQLADLVKHEYTEIFGGSVGCTIVLNGVSVGIASSSNLKLRIKTVTGGIGCFLLGENKDVYDGSPNAG